MKIQFKKIPQLFLLTLLLSRCASKGPEADSGPDQIIAGATSLVSDTPIKDIVSISEGDQTDWYLLKGENLQSEITFLSSGSKKLSANLYRVHPRKLTKTLLKVLRPSKANQVFVKKNDLYIQVQAKHKSGEYPYSLVRRDLSKGSSSSKLSKISVIDIYPLAGKESLVLMNASEDLKVGSTLTIRGYKDNTNSVELGDCEVSSVSDGQASCTLATQLTSKYTQYKALQVN